MVMEKIMSINIFKLEEYLARHEFSAKYLLCCSDAESYTMEEVIAMASVEEKQLWNRLSLGYTEVPGLPALRETIAHELYKGLCADDILCFAGAEEGIFCVLSTLIEKGDHVIVLTPCYQSLVEIPKWRGATVSELELQEENAWRIDLNLIAKNIRPNTKCIIINFPHNPTGQTIEEGELQKLINLCEQHGIWLFSDEVYRLLGEPNNTWANPAACSYPKAFSLGVMSKAFGMAGLRSGWIACQDKEMLEKVKHVKHYTSICNSAPSEILSLIALRNKDKILERNNEIVRNNLKRLKEFFKEYEDLFAWRKPQGGCVGFVRYKGEEPVDSFCDRLLEDKSVLLMPASIYNYKHNFFRIGFGRRNMDQGLGKLKEFLDNENI
jgi:aspartate/methionine/tyrosine aminotransferase